ncbi:MAG: hypothetical protein ACWGQW_00585 [bacterium]
MEELFKDMSETQLEEVLTKYPKYAEAVEKEKERRQAEAEAIQAKIDKAMEAEAAKESLKGDFKESALLVFPNKPEGINNILVTWKEKVVNEGKNNEHVELEMVIIDNVIWKASGSITSGSNKENKGSRVVTVSKVVNGSIVETYWFDNAELASQYFGVPKDKGSAVKRLKDYDSDGIQFLVSNGAKEGIIRKEVEAES